MLPCFVSPSSIAVKSNCLRCGSSVAPKKPIDALVAIILNAHTKTPGIFIKDWTVAREGNIVIITYYSTNKNIKSIPLELSCCTTSSCFGKIHIVITAVKRSNSPSDTKGK